MIFIKLRRNFIHKVWNKLGQLWNYKLPWKIIKVGYFHFCSTILGTFPTLNVRGHFENFMMPNHFCHIIKVEKSLHLSPNIMGTLVSFAWNVFASLKICMLFDNVKQIVKVEFLLGCYPPFQVFSQMKKNMLVRTTLEVLMNMRRYF